MVGLQTARTHDRFRKGKKKDCNLSTVEQGSKKQERKTDELTTRPQSMKEARTQDG